MRTLSEALDILQADQKVNVGYLLPTLKLLLKKMEDLIYKSDIKHCMPIVTTIINSIKSRFEECFEDNDLKIAAMLNPQFKTSWIEEQTNRNIHIS